MGCASSKQKKRCPHCRNPMTRRSYSLHAHQPSPERNADNNYHIVAFSSSTLGSLKLENIHFDNRIYSAGDETKNEVSMMETKTWSKMMDEKIPKIVPKTPIRTPPGEPETVNLWEVMEGLEDVSPFRPPDRHRSFSFDAGGTPIRDSFGSDFPGIIKASDLDEEVLSTFRKSFQELPPDDPFHLRSPAENRPPETPAGDRPSSHTKPKLVVYFTTLRGVRRTYEDCCQIRAILKATGARVDERDVSMDAGFKQELKELLGDNNGSGLPKVFVGENYVGGAEEVRRLHEDGELQKVVERCEKVEEGGGCEVCGDVRFVPCETCSGSCKVYCGEEGEDKEEEQEEEEGEVENGFQRCPDCNENGLIRCPVCCC